MGGVGSRQTTRPRANTFPAAKMTNIPINKDSLLQRRYHHHREEDESNHHNNYPVEIIRLRNEIRNQSKITLETKYVFLLFCPPEYPLLATANYLSSRLELPVVSYETKTPLQDFLFELNTNELYEDGSIICRYPVNMFDIGQLKRQIENEDGKLYLLYFDIDAQTFQTVLKKFDRYVHLASNRSYHLLETPPKSLLKDDNDNPAHELLDDLTGEPLVKLPDDTPEGYREKFQEYHQQHLPIFINFFNIARIVEGEGGDLGDDNLLNNSSQHSHHYDHHHEHHHQHHHHSHHLSHHPFLDQTIYKIISSDILERLKTTTTTKKKKNDPSSFSSSSPSSSSPLSTSPFCNTSETMKSLTNDSNQVNTSSLG